MTVYIHLFDIQLRRPASGMKQISRIWVNILSDGNTAADTDNCWLYGCCKSRSQGMLVLGGASVWPSGAEGHRNRLKSDFFTQGDKTGAARASKMLWCQKRQVSLIGKRHGTDTGLSLGLGEKAFTKSATGKQVRDTRGTFLGNLPLKKILQLFQVFFSSREMSRWNVAESIWNIHSSTPNIRQKIQL